MIKRPLLGLLACATAFGASGGSVYAADQGRVLIYSGTTGYRHESIPAGVEALKGVATKLGYAADATEDPQVFTAEKLSQYKAIVFLSNTTDPKTPESEWLTGARRDALVNFMRAGKGVLGVHAACDSHYHWPWYGQLMGGYFQSHPKGTPPATLTLRPDPSLPGLDKLPKTISRADEWYYYKDFNPLVRVLVTVDPATIGAGEADANPNPLVWYQEFGGGRVFYNGMGHTSESFSEPYMVDLLTIGLAYAAGR